MLGIGLLLLFTLTPHALAETGETADGEMVVTEDRQVPEDRFEDPHSVTIVPVDERLPHAADVADVLHRVAGARVVHLGGLGDFSAVGLRGASLRQVQVFLDGVPLNPDGAQTVNLAELPLRAFKRVEVYRGNAPAKFAASPIGGVINLVTGERMPSSHAGLTVGSHRTVRMNALGGHATRLGQTPTDVLLFADALSIRGDYRYFSDNGTPYNRMDDSLAVRENNQKGQLSAHGRWRYGTDRLRFTLLDAFLDRNEGLPGHVNNPTDSASMHTRRNLLVAGLSGRTGPVRMNAHGWMQHRGERYDDRADELGVGAQHLLQRSNNLGAMGTVQWAASPWLVPGFTGSIRRDGFSATELIEDLDTAPQTRLAGVAVANADLQVGDWKASPVLQFNALNSRWEGADSPQLWTMDPRMGLAWTATKDLVFRANGGRYLRPPDLSELFGDRGSIVGNAALRPERGWQWDVGGRGRLAGDWGTAQLDLAHFWLASEDLITYVQNSQRTLRPVNLGRAWVQGLETGGFLDILGWLDSQTSFTWTLSRNLDTDPAVANNQLPRIPTVSAWQGTSVHWAEWIRLGHTWSWTDGNYWDATNWFRSAPRSIHGVFLRGQPSATWPSFELAVRNVMDSLVEVVPRNPLDRQDDSRMVQPLTDFTGYPLPGRTFLFSVRWTAPPRKTP